MKQNNQVQSRSNYLLQVATHNMRSAQEKELYVS